MSDQYQQPTQSRAVAISGPRLPCPEGVEKRFGIDKTAWRALTDAVFPSATKPDSIILALSYCRARKLDPFKKPVHIVPVWDARAGGMVDTIWPGIGELRTTAFRTKLFAGCDAVEFGPDETKTFIGKIGKRGQERDVSVEVTFPSWGVMTVYRMIDGQRVAFQGPKVYWAECYGAQGKSSVPNDMWARRPRGQLEKCVEAAALRRAFPEEIGEVMTSDEMAGQKINVDAVENKTDAPQIAHATRLDAFEATFSETREPVTVDSGYDADTGEVDDGWPGPDTAAQS